MYDPNLGIMGINEKVEPVEPDYKREFGVLAFLVAKAFAFMETNDMELCKKYLQRADELIERVNNGPHIRLGG